MVLDRAVNDVGHGLETAVRMPGGTLGFARCVLDCAQVVEQQEWIGALELRAREGPSHLEASALEVAGRGHDLDDGAKACGRRIGPRDSRQREQVFSGRGGHRVLLSGSVLQACLAY